MTGIGVLEDGRLASAYNSGSIKIWELGTKTCTETLTYDYLLDDEEFDGNFNSFAVLTGGKLVACGFEYHNLLDKYDEELGDIVIWDISLKRVVCSLQARGGYCQFALLKSGLLAGRDDRFITIWDLDRAVAIHSDAASNASSDRARCGSSVSDAGIPMPDEDRITTLPSRLATLKVPHACYGYPTLAELEDGRLAVNNDNAIMLVDSSASELQAPAVRERTE